MTRWTILLSVIVLGVCPSWLLANCPAGYPNEIFCDDWDTYCVDGGGYPGDPKCDPLTADANRYLMREVWYRTSTNEALGDPCGTEFTMEDGQALIFSPPFGGRYPSKIDLGQSTVRDWELSPPVGEPDQILDLHRLIGEVFGAQYAAVAATDAAPLVMEFYAAANVGKMFWSSGYMELAFSDETYMNRANTEYAMSPNCATYCSPAINQGPFPIICAQGNPAMPLPAGCPPVGITPPPVHQAIAVGALAVMDPDPCHCGVQAHQPINYHLNLYDGQLWWNLRKDSPLASTGTVTLIDGTPVPNPPSDIAEDVGDFGLSSPGDGKSVNFVRITVKTNTIDVFMLSRLKSGIDSQFYHVTSEMLNIPRAYTGPFDRIRGGVGSGCVLADNTSWETCTGSTDRSCIATASGYFVDFDDFVLYGGTGYSVNGACCLPNADCVNDLTQSACEEMTGRWQGQSTTCETLTCCPYPFADAEKDGDVDQDDFGLFQVCWTDLGGGVPTGCECFNRVDDNTIDINDFLEFAKCYTGANVPALPPPAPCNP